MERMSTKGQGEREYGLIESRIRRENYYYIIIERTPPATGPQIHLRSKLIKLIYSTGICPFRDRNLTKLI